MSRITCEEREAIVREAIAKRDAILAGKAETVLLVKRMPSGDFLGDKTWQVAPYQLRDAAHAQRMADWLAKSMGVSFEYRISTVVENAAPEKSAHIGSAERATKSDQQMNHSFPVSSEKGSALSPARQESV